MDKKIDLYLVAKTIIKKIYIIILAAIIFSLAFFGYGKYSSKQSYVCNSSIYLNLEIKTDEKKQEKIIPDCMVIMKSNDSLSQVSELVNNDKPSLEELNKIKLENPNNTKIIKIHYENANKDKALKTVQAFNKINIEKLKKIFPNSNIVIIDEPYIKVLNPNLNFKTYIKKGSVLGFLVGAACILIIYKKEYFV